MTYQAKGPIHVIGETEQVTDRFRKREFVLVLEPDGRYPQHVSFQLTGDNCDDIASFAVGDIVEVDFNLRGREWTSRTGDVRYFNSLSVRRIELIQEGGGPRPGSNSDGPGSPDPPDHFSDDDVPF